MKNMIFGFGVSSLLGVYINFSVTTGKSPELRREIYVSHRIHGTGIFTYLGLICMVNVGKYTSRMDPSILYLRSKGFLVPCKTGVLSPYLSCVGPGNAHESDSFESCSFQSALGW